MKVKNMMHRGVQFVEPGAKIAAIAAKMQQHDIGAIPVCDNGKPIGMVTDRDITIRALANGKDAAKLTAKDVMTAKVIYCRDSAEAEDANPDHGEQADPQASCARRHRRARRNAEPRRRVARHDAKSHR